MKKGFVVWLTGLSGSGKTTIAEWAKETLSSFSDINKNQIILLDGDEIRKGINKDLNFSNNDRTENLRRIAEIAKFLREKNFIVIVATMSPYRIHRETAKHIIGEEYFLEIFCNTSLDVCQQRDVKGLYAKSKIGDITNFIVDFELAPPWEILWLPTGDCGIDSCIEILIGEIERRFNI